MDGQREKEGCANVVCAASPGCGSVREVADTVEPCSEVIEDGVVWGLVYYLPRWDEAVLDSYGGGALGV